MILVDFELLRIFPQIFIAITVLDSKTLLISCKAASPGRSGRSNLLGRWQVSILLSRRFKVSFPEFMQGITLSNHKHPASATSPTAYSPSYLFDKLEYPHPTAQRVNLA